MNKNRIEKTFKELRKKDRKALIIYLTCGLPDLKTTEKLACLLQECRVDMIELGVPFSDPIADGPVIQGASQKALEKGVSLKQILKMVSRLRAKVRIPLLIMSYMNPVYRYGTEKFFRDCGKAGVDGVIIPDIIVEEGKELEKLSAKSGVDLVYFISPLTGFSRRKRIYGRGRGFIYMLSVAGTTGPREKFPGELKNYLSGIRKETKKPLALGFGISSPEQVRGLRKYVDGFIVGSAFIRVIMGARKTAMMREAKKYIMRFDEENHGK